MLIGLERLRSKHTGINLANITFKVFKEFGAERNIGYVIIDNAYNNDTLGESLENSLAEEESPPDLFPPLTCAKSHYGAGLPSSKPSSTFSPSAPDPPALPIADLLMLASAAAGLEACEAVGRKLFGLGWPVAEMLVRRLDAISSIYYRCSQLAMRNRLREQQYPMSKAINRLASWSEIFSILIQ